MFLNDSARVKILLLVLMGEIKINLTREKSFFLCVFFPAHSVGHLHFVYLYFYFFLIMVLKAGLGF